jgi:hypothetical protein
MFSRLLIAVLFFLLSSQSGMTVDYTYGGFIGATAPKDDEDAENAAARIAFNDSAAVIYIAHGFPKTTLYTGRLNNEVAGLLRGTLTTWQGTPIGEIELRRRVESEKIIWEGSLKIDSQANLVRFSRAQNAASNDVVDRSGNLVTKNFTRKLTLIHPELSLHAVPRFDRLPEAIAVLKSNFSYFGQSYTGPEFPESKFESRGMAAHQVF